MKCPSCSSENLPVREASTLHGVMGSVVKLPGFCAQCGAALTEKCPACQFEHPIGTKFCQANGADLEAWVREENAWKQLVQSLEVTLTVRPATALVTLVLSVLPALYFVGGYLFRETMREWRYEQEVVTFVMGMLFTVFITGLAALMSAAIPMNIINFIESERRRRAFREQNYKAFPFPG